MMMNAAGAWHDLPFRKMLTPVIAVGAPARDCRAGEVLSWGIRRAE
jgi:hypothetical protein